MGKVTTDCPIHGCWWILYRSCSRHSDPQRVRTHAHSSCSARLSISRPGGGSYFMPLRIGRSFRPVRTTLVLCAALTSALGQQRTPNDTLRSPEVDAQGKVTFRLFAPQAKQVRLQAEGRDATPGITPEQLKKES